MSLRTVLAAAVVLAATTSFVVAEDDPDHCYTTTDPRCSGLSCSNTFSNPAASLNWQQTRQAADPQVMQEVAGVYYGEIPDPSGQMTNRTYRSYESNGLWQYQDQTCTPGLGCSQNQGAGQWRFLRGRNELAAHPVTSRVPSAMEARKTASSMPGLTEKHKP
jgi:hypothetical protein